MSVDLPHGNVLVITDDEESGDRLTRWVAVAGERAVLLSGAERFLIREGDDESVDLLVTDLDTDEPEAFRLLERLCSGDLFADIPQIHILRDLAFGKRLQSWNAAIASLALHAPPEAGAFQARVRLAAEVGRLRREVARSSVRDDMTDLYNRRYFMIRMEEEISRARRYHTHLSLVLFDIDQLKLINDRYGETTGNRVIRGVGRTLERLRRKPDIVSRIGEESFGMILPVTRFRGAASLAGKVRTSIQSLSIKVQEEEVDVRISGGISAFPDNTEVEDPAGLMRFADQALSEAKRRGGNRIHIDEGTIQGKRRLVLIADPDPSLLDQAEDLLAMDDYRVVRAESAVTALETLRFRIPDLLIIDLQMPGREHDESLIEGIRAAYPESSFPIIGLSGEPGLRPCDLQPLGVDRFVTKPFSVSLLRNVARELTERSSE